MRVYISGKMNGLSKEAYRGKFKKAQKDLIKMGHKPINPARLDVYDLEYKDFLAIDAILIKSCEAIYMLDNWEDSAGALWELAEANRLGLKVMYEGENGK